MGDKKEKKGFFRDFADFIKRGNVVDLAVAFIIGGAFQKIVSSLVNDIIMPLIGGIFRYDIKTAQAILKPAEVDAAGKVIKNAVILKYGSFIQSIIDFLIIALAIFVGLRIGMRISKKIAEGKSKLMNDSDEIKPE